LEFPKHIFYAPLIVKRHTAWKNTPYIFLAHFFQKRQQAFFPLPEVNNNIIKGAIKVVPVKITKVNGIKNI
tara:strand:+ start:557 stop:769 length:213 start_codon:yes stop_codon:yes gene_type:complete